MRTRTILYKPHNKNDKAFLYFAAQAEKAKSLRNTVNYYIRNAMTGLQKSPEERTHHETEVLHHVFTCIQKAREQSFANGIRHARKELNDGVPSLLARKMLHNARTHQIPYPTAENWFLGYNALDAVMKHSKNACYYALPAQANQQVIRKVVHDWMSYFAALRSYNQDRSAFLAKPKMPGYTRGRMFTMAFTNQVCRLTHTPHGLFLTFPGLDTRVKVSNDIWYAGRYVKTEVVPYAGAFKICITTNDGTVCPAVPKDPKRVYGIDPGVSNFLACANNFGGQTFIINGRHLKARNQWFNKRRASLLSVLARGSDSRHSVKHSHQLDALTMRRDGFIRDFFYKCAHLVCRMAGLERVDVIVIGHNEGQKQSMDTGHVNNQSFTAIPFLRFCNMLQQIASGYGIPVVIREESYTSKADALSGEPIPTYGKPGAKEWKSSGKRIKRGLYRSKDGRILNADINGAANIARKEFPDAFRDVDLSFLCKKPEICGFFTFYKDKQPDKSAVRYIPKHSHARRVRRSDRKRRHAMYKALFAA